MKLDVLALLAAVVSHDGLRASAAALASDLATRIGCERVSIGFVEDRFSRVVAVSHGVIEANRGEMLRVIGAAMDESIEQAATVVAPTPHDHVPQIVLAHEELLRRDGGMAITIPLAVAHQLVGAVLFQFRDVGPVPVAGCGVGAFACPAGTGASSHASQ